MSDRAECGRLRLEPPDCSTAFPPAIFETALDACAAPASSGWSERDTAAPCPLPGTALASLGSAWIPGLRCSRDPSVFLQSCVARHDPFAQRRRGEVLAARTKGVLPHWRNASENAPPPFGKVPRPIELPAYSPTSGLSFSARQQTTNLVPNRV